MIKANYSIIEETSDLVLILDLGPWDQYMTITNAAEQVVAELMPRLDGRRLEYIDSEGERGQLIVKDGKFAGFKPVITEPTWKTESKIEGEPRWKR